jgi:hypothetical protein
MPARPAAVVPDCAEPDRWHDPPGGQPAAYWYRYRGQDGLDGLVRVLCAECCARYRVHEGEPGIPAATYICVLLDANTQQPVL